MPALALLTLNPVPNNHLFIAAGLANAPLAPILGVFIAGRFVSYVPWAGAADTAATSLREVVGPSAGGWAGAAVQIAGFAALLLVMRLDWSRLLRRLRPTEEQAASGPPIMTAGVVPGRASEETPLTPSASADR